MKIGYGKLGRSMPLTLSQCGNLGGDVEMVPTIDALARRHPDDEFWLLGRNSGEEPVSVGLPSNVINPWKWWGPAVLEAKRAVGLNHPDLSIEEHDKLGRIFDEITTPTFVAMDALVLWVGQHGTTNSPIPGVRKEGLTKPHDWCALYCSYVLRGVNAWRDVDPWKREEVWLNSDPRNYMKMRDLKWPLRHPVLTQYTFINRMKHERYGDGDAFEEWSAHNHCALERSSHRDRLWLSYARNEYARLEVNSLLPGAPFAKDAWFRKYDADPAPFGIFINETRRYVNSAKTRSRILRDWVLPLEPAFIHGTWSKEGQAEVGRVIEPLSPSSYFTRLRTVRSTFTTPASGTGWATAKPWEAFAVGVVCFFHPDYDDQDNIIGDAHPDLRRWLRVESPEQLADRVKHMAVNDEHWRWVIAEQYNHFRRAVTEPRYLTAIEERIWK